MLKYHIQTIEVPSGGSSAITFSNIPQTFDDLELVVSSRNTGANTERDIFLQFNGSTSGYSQRRLYGDGGAAYSDTLTSGADALRVGFASGTNQTANTFGSMKVFIPNYRANSAKSVSSDSVTENNATRAMQSIHAGLWSDTAAINSINLQLILSQVFAQFSSASLYGIKRGSDGRTEVASGGTITTSGGFTIHTFTGSGTFVANRNLNAEYVVVGGGGGAGGASGAAAGAGGYRSSVQGESSGGATAAEPRLSISAGQSLLVQVGAGGTGWPDARTNGNTSSLGPIQALGGGAVLAVGASGGGGAAGDLAGRAGTAGQGFAGGNGSDNAGGGGGGAGAVGSAASGGAGGNGGNGVSSVISGTSVFRAGGGGGGGQFAAGIGGLGGGGNGLVGTNNGNTSGAANTGGGAGSPYAVLPPAAAGGSGIVIIRYLTPA